MFATTSVVYCVHMKKILSIFAISICLCLLGSQLVFATTPAKITLTSPAFKSGGMIPDEYTYENTYCGWGESIPLDWKVDEATASQIQSFAITMVDTNFSAKNYVHLMVANIQGDVRSAVQNAFSPTGSKEPPGTYFFTNSHGRPGYDGPNPPRGRPSHNYLITIYGLNVPSIGLSPLDKVTFSDFKKAMVGKIVAKGTLRGRYKMRKRIVLDACGDFNK